jgi:DnaJ-domain-containing protein 1
LGTHYELLGVSETATNAQIKRAYYSKARAYHPDRHAGSSRAVLAEAEQSMAALNAAWDVLGDERQRSDYDRALEDERNGGSTRPRTRRRSAPAKPKLSLPLGKGIHYWMGTSGVVKSADGHGMRVNLVVDTARDLTSLRSFAPDGVSALHCGGSAIDDAQLVHIGELTGLQLLDLSHTRITDTGLLHLSRLTHLQHLWLWGTEITDAGLAIVGRLESLRLLGIGNTAITDSGVAHLSGLHDLRVLQLVGTNVRGPGLDSLHGLTSLERVTLPWRVRGRHRRRLKAALPNATVA